MHRIRFEGPATLAVGIATALAESEGVDLTSSEPPVFLDHDVVRLDITAAGRSDVIAAVVARVGSDLPASASITIQDG